MKKKLIHSIVALAILFVSLSGFKGSVVAMSPPYLSLDCEKDVVTDCNAILNAKLNNVEGKRIEAFEITIFCGNAKVSSFQKIVNDSSRRICVSFDLKKEAGINLETNKRYDYTISAIAEEDVNPSMYTASHHFITQSIEVTAITEKVKPDTAILKIKVHNADRQCIKQIGVKVFLGSKQIKVFSRTVNKTDQDFTLSLDVKKDMSCLLKPNTKYTYTVYAEVDVSQSYLYQAMSVCDGKVKTSEEAGVKTNVIKSKKNLTLKNIIHNPYAKKISEIKVIIKNGNAQQIVCRKKVAKNKQYLKNQTVKVSLDRTKLKKILKSKKITCMIYVRIGGKLCKAKVTV